MNDKNSSFHFDPPRFLPKIEPGLFTGFTDSSFTGFEIVSFAGLFAPRLHLLIVPFGQLSPLLGGLVRFVFFLLLLLLPLHHDHRMRRCRKRCDVILCDS